MYYIIPNYIIPNFYHFHRFLWFLTNSDIWKKSKYDQGGC